jgi:multiple sugar transport system ATP-binding protein
MNLRTAVLVENGVRLGNTTVPVERGTLAAAARAGLGEITLGVRPECLSVTDAGRTGLKMEVALVEELGGDAYVYGRLDGDTAQDKLFIVRFDGRTSPSVGETVNLDVRTGSEHHFDPTSGQRLVGD